MLVILATSCKNQTKKDVLISEEKKEISTSGLNQLQWLLGEWGIEDGQEVTKEIWNKVDDSTFTGFAYTKVAKDTVFAETLVLQQLQDAMFLTVVAFNQNGDLPVVFGMVALEDGKVVFENKAHDFPQRIVYTNPSKDSIHAWVEGRVGDTLKKIDFYYSKQ